METNPHKLIAADFPAELDQLKYESTLYLNDSLLTEIDGDNDIIASSAYIKINQVGINSLDPILINASALRGLYYDSIGLRVEPLDILGLKITFGMNSGRLYLLYQTVCLTLLDNANDARIQNQGIFEIINTSPFYKYNTAFDLLDTTDPDYAKKYKDDVKILHKKGQGFKPFDPKTDVTSVIFSFQEIFALLYENDNSAVLRIYNCIRRVADTTSFNIKHSLVLASLDTSPTFTDKKIFEGKYANLAHLCPPNCIKFIYPLE